MASQDETAGQNDAASRNDSTGQSQVDKVLSTAADAMRVPVDIARQVLPGRGGLPVYAGLGALAVIGLIDWPVAAAAGAGYALARLSSRPAS
ncbi:MAG: hypothetical protein JOY82_24735, partial [Streptosporangiaceae bacterium]|nr:hypothetical protein [Streptosporangiaceae bacterium]